MDDICSDLAAEHDDLDHILATLAAADWDRDTPAEGWTIRDTVDHLLFFDRQAITAASDPENFSTDLREVGAAVDASQKASRSMPAPDLLATWRDGRRRMIEVFRTLDPKARIPWYGPAMGALSFVTARLMETWAHGQDVCDAVGQQRPPSERLRHVAHIGVRAFPWSYTVNGLTPPNDPVRVELDAPGGGTWDWGPADAADRVTGPALDFCLVVTQRRHRDDTSLRTDGPVADQWLSIAQAFAGPPGTGRQAGQFR